MEVVCTCKNCFGDCHHKKPHQQSPNCPSHNNPCSAGRRRQWKNKYVCSPYSAPTQPVTAIEIVEVSAKKVLEVIPA